AAVALAEPPGAAFPALVLLAADTAGEVHPLQPAPVLRPLEQRGNVELPARIVRDHRVGRAANADAAGQRAGVDAGEADLALRLHPVDELALGAEARVRGDLLAHHAADGAFDLRLDVLRVGADVADVREGEGDDLRGIGRVGQDLLVAGHRGVEAHLADGAPGR